MKVKNIMFSGFMAAILMSATGAADAAISVASKDYVDAKSGAVSQALETYKTANDAKVNKNAEDIATNSGSIQSVANSLTTLTGVVGTKAGQDYVDTELAKKVDLTVYNEKMTALGNTDTSLQSQIDAVKQLTGTEGVADQIAEAVNAEKSAREAADAQIRTDFAAADATTLQSAKDYADGLATNYDASGSADAALAAAKTYAESEADAAEAAAKSYADGLATNYDSAGSAATAKSEAIAAAATDATNKANQALTDAKAYADEKDTALKTVLEGQIASASGNATQVANDLASYKTDNDAAVAAAKKAGDDAQADLDAYKTENDAAVAAAKKAGDDAQADLDAYKSSNDTALAGVKTTAEQGVADAAAAAQAAADAAEAAAQALTDAKTYADGKDAETLASAKTYAEGQASAAQEAAEATAAADATSKANAAQAAAEQTAATALASAKSEIETELAKKITAPAACETQDCVLSISKATNTISWVPLTEPVADYLNQ